VDEETGALLVKIGDVEVKVDVAELDVTQIIQGIAGNKTLQDIYGRLPADMARESGKLTDMAAVLAKWAAGSRSIAVTGVTNATAIVPGTSSGSAALAGSSTPYHRAIVFARKPSAANHTPPGDNAGVVYIGKHADNNCKYSTPLAPGSWMELPPQGDLSQFGLMVATANDGVIVVYEA